LVPDAVSFSQGAQTRCIPSRIQVVRSSSLVRMLWLSLSNCSTISDVDCAWRVGSASQYGRPVSSTSGFAVVFVVVVSSDEPWRSCAMSYGRGVASRPRPSCLSLGLTAGQLPPVASQSPTPGRALAKHPCLHASRIEQLAYSGSSCLGIACQTGALVLDSVGLSGARERPGEKS
jgi:hypothetical protein